ncbi:MAG: hypothetical protein QOJ99_4646 [Bryobacterales bacterium]|nr:hypothetical protein [Bryobacterales bacterium]
MQRALASSLLSLLLITTLLWGGCISCEQYFMLQGAKDCCNPDGHCKTKAPANQGPGRECKQLAFDHHKALHLVDVDLSVVAILRIEPPLSPLYAGRAFPRRHEVAPADPSPPDLQVLHSTFLI